MANAGKVKVVVTVGNVSDEAATSIEDLGVPSPPVTPMS
jgi:hypothetical protein